MIAKKKSRGRPATGKNTVTIAFSVHKDFADRIKQVVKDTVVALKNAQSAKFVPAIEQTEPPAAEKGSAKESVVKKKGAKNALESVESIVGTDADITVISKKAGFTKKPAKSKGITGDKADRLRQFRANR